MAVNHPSGWRQRPWWRSRRLIAAVVIVDLLAAASLAYAVTHSGSTTPRPAAPTVLGAVAPSTPRPAMTVTASPPTSMSTPAAVGRPHIRRRQRHKRPVARVVIQPRQPPGAAVSFARLAFALPGAVGVAIAPLGMGPVTTFGSLQVGHAWSTMKVPVLTTLLAESEQSGRPLSPQLRDDAARALTASDRTAAEALFSTIEASAGGVTGASERVQDTLRTAGDNQTMINTAPNSQGFTTWGQSQWSASGEVDFYRALAQGCLLSAPDTSYVLSLMSQVIPDQRWGAGSAGLSTGTLGFKGGWGPEAGGDYLVRQTAIIGSGARGYVFAMLARPSDGAFSTGTKLLTDTAAWVRHTFPETTTPRATCS